MGIEIVGVVGLGTMGAGIAEVLARQGLRVVAVDAGEVRAAAGLRLIEASSAKAVQRGKLTVEARADLLARVSVSGELNALAPVDLVVEAVPERLDVKRELFTRLEAIVAPTTILATNTSSLSVTELAAGTQHPGRVLGLHFFNPATVQPLVEIISTVLTDARSREAVTDLAQRLGKVSVAVGDRAGFVANALLFGYLNQAVSMLDSHRASAEDLDAAMTLGAGLPMGPLALLDLIGLDTAVQILDRMFSATASPRHAANPLLRELVTAGLSGRKSGRGFFSYPTATSAGSPEAHTFSGLSVVGEGAAGWVEAFGSVVGQASARALNAVPDADDAGGLVVTARDRHQAVVGRAPGSGAPIALYWAEPLAAPPEPAGPKLIEVVPAIATDPELTRQVVGLLRDHGHYPLVCADRAGRVVRALLYAHLNDAVTMLDSGYASAADIDLAMTAGCGYRIGPLALADRIGLDVVLNGLREAYAERREPSLAPSPLLVELVAAGHLGRATGRGIRDRPGSPRP